MSSDGADLRSGRSGPSSALALASAIVPFGPLAQPITVGETTLDAGEPRDNLARLPSIATIEDLVADALERALSRWRGAGDPAALRRALAAILLNLD